MTLAVQGKRIGGQAQKSYRHGEVLRDSIQNINQERIAAQISQNQMHLQHKKQKGMPQFQTLQVFKEKRPAYEIDVSTVLSSLQLSRDAFVDFCVLVS